MVKGYVPDGVLILAKLEKFNPGGSSKDRAATLMLLEAVRRGYVDGKTVVEASSGNTAVSLAMVGASLGLRVLLFVPEGPSGRKVELAKEFGAEVVLTPYDEGTDGALMRVRSVVEEHPDRYYHPDQYNNPLNPLAHYLSTGPEIWRQTSGSITHFVAGVGTGGTVVGTGRYLKEVKPSVRVVGVQPESPEDRIPGLKHLPTSVRPGIYDDSVIDLTVNTSSDEGKEWRERLLRHGLSVGPSSGAALSAAVKVANSDPEARVVVVLFPDGGERY